MNISAATGTYHGGRKDIDEIEAGTVCSPYVGGISMYALYNNQSSVDNYDFYIKAYDKEKEIQNVIINLRTGERIIWTNEGQSNPDYMQFYTFPGAYLEY